MEIGDCVNANPLSDPDEVVSGILSKIDGEVAVIYLPPIANVRARSVRCQAGTVSVIPDESLFGNMKDAVLLWRKEHGKN